MKTMKLMKDIRKEASKLFYEAGGSVAVFLILLILGLIQPFISYPAQGMELFETSETMAKTESAQISGLDKKAEPAQINEFNKKAEPAQINGLDKKAEPTQIKEVNEKNEPAELNTSP